MQGNSIDAPHRLGPMQRRRITLADGRYLIFYTFGEPNDTDPSRSRVAGSVAGSGADERSDDAPGKEEHRV